MKQHVATAALLLLGAAGAFAQNAKVQTAWNYLKYDKLEEAAEAIDAASEHSQTSGREKTWYYRGLVYQAIYEDTVHSLREKYPECLKKAYESYARVMAMDPKSEYAAEIGIRMPVVLNHMFQAGVDQYNNKHFEAALGRFEQILALNPKDTLAMLNAGFSAERSQNNEKAKRYFGQLVDMEYHDPKIYLFLSKIYKAEGDSTRGLSFVKQARERFPDDNNLVIEELNYFLASGNNKEALGPLNTAIEKAPDNHNLYFARGNVYDKIGDSEKAKTDYLKAIELKPDYFDAYYNLGAMFFNQGADLANKANNIPPSKQKEYEAAKKKADAKFMEAMPYLEKANELDPDDTSTLLSLKQLYARIGETVKYEKVKARLEQ